MLTLKMITTLNTYVHKNYKFPFYNDIFMLIRVFPLMKAQERNRRELPQRNILELPQET